MFESNGGCGTAVRNGSIILLARVVGSDGASISREDLGAIEYSIKVVDPNRPSESAVAPGHDAVALVVDDVVFDTLQVDDFWEVDEVGYNFRHKVALGDDVVAPQAGGLCEVRYVFTPTAGENSSLRFQLQLV